MPDLELNVSADGPVEFYRTVLKTLHRSDVPFLVGGTFAMETLAGISRQTKDLDLFVRRQDWAAACRALRDVGIDTRIVYAHWLGKATYCEFFVDLIFASGNGLARVDDTWLTHGSVSTILDVPVRVCPPEEMMWSKSFVMERERFDGADVLHILRHSGKQLNWQRLLARFDGHSNVLLAHVMLFTYVYPAARDIVPAWVLDELWKRRDNQPPGSGRECRGTLLSRTQYLVDVDAWGFSDARLGPHGTMSGDEVAAWSAEIEPSTVPLPAPSLSVR